MRLRTADCGKDIYFWWQTVAFLQGDRKFPISALTQPTADARGKSSNVNEPLGRYKVPYCLLIALSNFALGKSIDSTADSIVDIFNWLNAPNETTKKSLNFYVNCVQKKFQRIDCPIFLNLACQLKFYSLKEVFLALVTVNSNCKY